MGNCPHTRYQGDWRPQVGAVTIEYTMAAKSIEAKERQVARRR
jgi:hypothetical protein